MNQKIRIQSLKQAPISYKDIDIIVGAEKYLDAAEDFDLIEMIQNYYNIPNQKSLDRIKMIWQFHFSSWILHNHKKGNQLEDEIKSQAIQIYNQEALRFLSSIFHLEHNFWVSYYKLQKEEKTKPLCALESLNHLAAFMNPIHHQLLCIAVKTILSSMVQEENMNTKQIHLEKEILLNQALRFLGDLPLIELKTWIKNRLALVKKMR